MNVYLKAVVPTVFLLLIGIMIGIWIDNYRLASARKAVSESEIDWNDAQLLHIYLGNLGKDDCELAFNQNLEYNNKIYEKGMEIEKVMKANVFTPEVKQEWKRYVLLQTQFWFNSIELKERCDLQYQNVVHLYRLENLPQEEFINNKVQSSVLLELKERCGNKIMLIPLTTDLDLVSVETIVKQYNIEQFPAVIVDEKYVFQGLTSLEELMKVVNC